MEILRGTDSPVKGKIICPSLSARAYIHYDPERVDYCISAGEFEKLLSAGRNSWRDFCLVATPLGLSCSLNAAILITNQHIFTLTVGIFLNSLLGLVALALAICFACLWWRTRA